MNEKKYENFIFEKCKHTQASRTLMGHGHFGALYEQEIYNELK